MNDYSFIARALDRRQGRCALARRPPAITPIGVMTTAVSTIAREKSRAESSACPTAKRLMRGPSETALRGRVSPGRNSFTPSIEQQAPDYGQRCQQHSASSPSSGRRFRSSAP